jgi:hypothetical protein
MDDFARTTLLPYRDYIKIKHVTSRLYEPSLFMVFLVSFPLQATKLFGVLACYMAK